MRERGQRKGLLGRVWSEVGMREARSACGS